MKIAQVVCAFPPYAGGIANSASQIGELLSRQHEVTTFSPVNLNPWLKYGHGSFLPQLFWRLPRFDYIYLHYPFFGTAEVVWLFKLFFKRPKLILHYHMDVRNLGLIAKILSLPSRLIRFSLLNQAEIIVSASLDYIKESQIKKYYTAHPEKFQEIPFGLDTEKFCPKNLNRPAENKIIAQTQKIIHFINDQFIKKNRLDLLFVGGLDRAHYFKGIPILFQALASSTQLNWRLTIVGSGDLQPDYEKLATDLQLTAKLEFAGKLNNSDLIRAYQNADLLILPSINSNEAFGLVLIEALSCGVPVIASDLPGVRRVFANYQEGLLVEPGSDSDLRKKLEFIFNNEELRRTMAQAARHLAEKKYSLDIMAQKLNKLFL